MAQRPILRSLHDLGLAAWFGGALMGTIGVNGTAARSTSSQDGEDLVSGVGWDLWTPVGAAAATIHVFGAVGLVLDDRTRLRHQRGTRSMAVAKTTATAAALAVTGYTAWQGRRVEQNVPATVAVEQTVVEQVPVPVGAGLALEHRSTERDVLTEVDVADEAARDDARRRLRVLQWVVPAVTGALVVISAVAAEQQRAEPVARGIAAAALAHLPGVR